MSKLLSLDIGDTWTGIAITDVLSTVARPCNTIKTVDLYHELDCLIRQHELKEIIIGYPITMQGTESKQTKKVIEVKTKLESFFTDVQFTLWDERLSSKRAQMLMKPHSYKNKQEKLKEHARAAAFILDSYLYYLKIKRDDIEQS